MMHKVLCLLKVMTTTKTYSYNAHYLVRFGRGAAVSTNGTKCSVASSEIHITTTENIGRLSHVK
jgi:hypothetical protein